MKSKYLIGFPVTAHGQTLHSLLSNSLSLHMQLENSSGNASSYLLFGTACPTVTEVTIKGIDK